MSWELLPIELRVLILSFRNKKRNQACKIIQKKWGQYFAPKYAAVEIAFELQVDDNGTILTMWKSTARILDYCSRVLTGHTHEEFWNIILENLNEGLKKDDILVSRYNIHDKRAVYYYQVKQAYDTLIERFSNFG